MRKGDRIMKDYTDRSRLHLDTVDKLDYRALLAGQLEASADRICEYLDCNIGDICDAIPDTDRYTD